MTHLDAYLLANDLDNPAVRHATRIAEMEGIVDVLERLLELDPLKLERAIELSRNVARTELVELLTKGC